MIGSANWAKNCRHVYGPALCRTPYTFGARAISRRARHSLNFRHKRGDTPSTTSTLLDRDWNQRLGCLIRTEVAIAHTGRPIRPCGRGCESWPMNDGASATGACSSCYAGRARQKARRTSEMKLRNSRRLLLARRRQNLHRSKVSTRLPGSSKLCHWTSAPASTKPA